jgi:hypothetical protein
MGPSYRSEGVAFVASGQQNYYSSMNMLTADSRTLEQALA